VAARLALTAEFAADRGATVHGSRLPQERGSPARRCGRVHRLRESLPGAPARGRPTPIASIDEFKRRLRTAPSLTLRSSLVAFRGDDTIEPIDMRRSGPRSGARRETHRPGGAPWLRATVHVRVGHRGPPGQDRGSDLRRGARRDAAAGSHEPRGVRDAGHRSPPVVFFLSHSPQPTLTLIIALSFSHYFPLYFNPPHLLPSPSLPLLYHSNFYPLISLLPFS
jgi:hypothetical protein